MCKRPNVFGLSRNLWNDPDIPDAEFSPREAFAWLIASAAWSDLRTRGNAGDITLKRGEFSFSIRFLAEKWKWKKDRVHRLIERFKKRDILRDTSRDGCQVYFIKNYNKYQIVGVPQNDGECDSLRDTNATAPRQERDKEETRITGIEDISSLRSDIGPAAQAPAEPAPPSQPDPVPAKPHEASAEAKAVLTAYNAVAAEAGWPLAQHLTPRRRAAIRARLREAGGLAGWQSAMARARASPFLLGQRGRDGAHANWSPDFDFFLKPEHFTKLMEGAYGDEFGGKTRPAEPGATAAARRVIARLRGGAETQLSF